MPSDFYAVLTAAVADLTEHGFDSADRLTYWTDQIRTAAKAQLTPDWKLEEMVRNAMGAVYARLVERGQIAKYHPGVERFTIARLAPRLRAELDRRVMASAQLIRLNKDEMVERTVRRFAGWASSIPAGGSDVVDRGETKSDIRKSLASLDFQERRVIIDQTHKLNASLNNIIATDGGAIALIWHSHWRQTGYNYRVDHKERDGHVYLLRESWARTAGYVKPGDAGYYDEVTAVGEEVYCRCYAQYLYHLRQLPDDMVTAKGRSALKTAREAQAS